MTTFAVAELTLAPLSNFDLGALCAAAVALVAWRVRALTAGGALAAFVVGTCAVGGLGGAGAAILLSFFLSSVALSRAGAAHKRALTDVLKGGARDALQVLANGGVAAACAVAFVLSADARYAAAFAGAFAAANSDTWGTEVGTLVAQRPRSILTLRPVAPGLSGGVTVAGTVAEIAGALLVAAVAVAVSVRPFWAIAVAGVCGALVDSALGGSLQALRRCPQCDRLCESDPHACGANTELVRGASWMGNDAVNLAATLSGAAVAFALAG